MKTTVELESIIIENKNIAKKLSLSGQKHDTRRAKVILKKNKEYIELLRYLETAPKEVFIKTELKRLQSIIKSKNNQYSNWEEHSCPTEIPIKKKKSFL